jgi:hypothetical protein
VVEDSADVLSAIALLPEAEQGLLFAYLKRHLLDVLDDARWEQLWAQSPSALDVLSAEVDAAIAAGDIEPIDLQ